MRKKKMWRYYCDFCGKAGGHPYHMQKHEQGCTMNPDRECGLCRFDGEWEQKPMAELLEAYGSGGLDKLRDATEGCPACILATLRQFLAIKEQLEEPVFMPEFDFKKELASFWSDHNEERPDYRDYY